jgi:putative hydroxymethylpyrimidine transport system permease protein
VILAPLIFAALVLGAWQLYATYSGVPESSLPAPSQIAQAAWDIRDLLLDNAWVTVQEILLGFGIAIVLGVALGVAIHSSRLVERAIYPWLVASQTIPIVAVAPIIVIWTGFDLRPKVIVVALVSFFPIAVGMIAGLHSADPELDRLLRTLRASRWQRLVHARVPAALPHVFSGLKVGAALTVVGAVFAEWVGSSEGLGYLVLTFNNQVATARMFAVIAVLALIGIALFGLMLLLERLLLPWYFDARSERALEPPADRTVPPR